MTFYVAHDAAGAILWAGETTDTPDAIATAWQLPPGAAVLVMDQRVDNPLAWRVEAGALVARGVIAPQVSAAHIAADGAAEAVISALPDPCTVTIFQQPPGANAEHPGRIVHGPAECAGGTLTITSAEAGRLLVDIAAGLAWAPARVVIDAG